jgi:hypothetical protein
MTEMGDDMQYSRDMSDAEVAQAKASIQKWEQGVRVFNVQDDYEMLNEMLYWVNHEETQIEQDLDCTRKYTVTQWCLIEGMKPFKSTKEMNPRWGELNNELRCCRRFSEALRQELKQHAWHSPAVRRALD